MSILSKAIKGIGKGASKVIKPITQGVGGVGGFLLGGPAGAYAGYKAGTGLGKLSEAALRGSSVPKAATAARGDLIQGAVAGVSAGALNGVGGKLKDLAMGIPGAGKVAGAVNAVKGAIPQGVKDAVSTGTRSLKDLAGIGQGSEQTGATAGLEGFDLGDILGGAASSVGGFVKNHPDELLAGAALLSGAKSQQEALELRKRALAASEGAYAERAGLRAKAMGQLENPVAPNIKRLYANAGNAYGGRY